MADESWRIQRNIFAEHRERLIEQVRRDLARLREVAGWLSSVNPGYASLVTRSADEAAATLRAVLGEEAGG